MKSTDVKSIEEELRIERGMLQHWTYLLENRDHKTKRLMRILKETQEELAEVEIQRAKAPEAVTMYTRNVERLENRLRKVEALSDPRTRKILRLRAELAKLESDLNASS